MKRAYILSFILIVIFFCQACKKDPELINKAILSGQAQKGPYINGSSIQMLELNSKLNQTGKVFNTSIQDDYGSFTFNDIKLIHPIIEILASGYYFNEISGDLSISTLSLSALADITSSSSVNINLITSIEKERVKYLFAQGVSFSEAKRTAQADVLRVFGFNVNDIGSSEMLDISQKTEGNAVLLAISVILQGDRSIADMIELISSISRDLKEDGSVENEDILNDLRNSALILDIQSVKANLEARYQELGIDIDLPEFEKYINIFLSFTGLEPVASILEPTKIETTSVTLNGLVNANDLASEVTFEYGLSESYGNAVIASPATVIGHGDENVSAVLNNLDPRKTYYYRIKAVNSKGTVYSNSSSFITAGDIPAANTTPANNISAYSAVLNASVNPYSLSTTIIFEYGTTTAYGSSVNAVQSPLNGNLTNVNALISSLIPGTAYHFRVKATNMLGTNIGNDQAFLTHGLLNDIDNNTYETVIIGTQTWMAENLKTTKLSDGSEIPIVTDNTAWANLTSPGLCFYNNNETEYKQVYGALYNWYCVGTNKICPSGWHVPNVGEFNTLLANANSNSLKEAGFEHWLRSEGPPICIATNSSGFRALPAGVRYTGFGELNGSAYFWSTSEYHIDRRYALRLLNWNESVYIGPYGQGSGFSIRCVKN